MPRNNNINNIKLKPDNAICEPIEIIRDEYAGLMTNREKQWLLNIQLSQLNTGTPYFDDYYYTVRFLGQVFNLLQRKNFCRYLKNVKLKTTKRINSTTLTTKRIKDTTVAHEIITETTTDRKHPTRSYREYTHLCSSKILLASCNAAR